MKFTRTYEFGRSFVGREKEEIGGIVGVQERRASMDLNGGRRINKERVNKGEPVNENGGSSRPRKLVGRG